MSGKFNFTDEVMNDIKDSVCCGCPKIRRNNMFDRHINKFVCPVDFVPSLSVTPENDGLICEEREFN